MHIYEYINLLIYSTEGGRSPGGFRWRVSLSSEERKGARERRGAAVPPHGPSRDTKVAFSRIGASCIACETEVLIFASSI